jgi:hypothetical protein
LEVLGFAFVSADEPAVEGLTRQKDLVVSHLEQLRSLLNTTSREPVEEL